LLINKAGGVLIMTVLSFYFLPKKTKSNMLLLAARGSALS
jgi:hypothetical protein